MAIWCLVFPAMVFCAIRHKIFECKGDLFQRVTHLIFEYLSGYVVINFLILGFQVFARHKKENMWDLLNSYQDFAIKYMIVGVVLAIMIPILEKYIRENIIVSVHVKRPVFSKMPLNRGGGVYLYAILMGSLHFVRCFNDCFWGDEGILINAARKNFVGMLQYVAGNGHTPFHYVVAWCMNQVFGESGFLWHLSATLPYFLILIVAVTLIRKWMGNQVSVLFITLCTLLDNAVKYNLEVRMYAWCQLFILLVFLMVYGLYHSEKNYYYWLTTLFAVGAVYSHYYALASIGLIYFVLLIYIFYTKKTEIWKVLLSGGSVIVLLIPWMIYAKMIRGEVVSDYGIAEVPFLDCIEFIFQSKYSMYLFALFWITLFLKFLYDYKIIEVIRIGNGKHKVSINISRERTKIKKEWIWMISGIAAVFGTIIAAELISWLFYPIIVLRYLYPSYIILWLLFAKNISSLKLNRVWTILLSGFIICTCISNYTDSFNIERQQNKKLMETLEITENIKENDVIYTNIVHFAWTVGRVYYPTTTSCLFGHSEFWGTDELPELDIKVDNWLFLAAPISEETISDLEEQGLESELIVEQGYIGTGNVWIYKVISSVDEMEKED